MCFLVCLWCFLGCVLAGPATFLNDFLLIYPFYGPFFLVKMSKVGQSTDLGNKVRFTGIYGGLFVVWGKVLTFGYFVLLLLIKVLNHFLKLSEPVCQNPIWHIYIALLSEL